MSTLRFLHCALLLNSAIAACHLGIGVVLGLDNHTRTHLGATSDQEQWAQEQAEADITADLAAIESLCDVRVSVVFAGDSDDPELVSAFLRECADEGTHVVVGPLSTGTLMAIADEALTLGTMLISPSSGLPNLPAPRHHIFRLWPSDAKQAVAMDMLLLQEELNSAVLFSRGDTLGLGLAEAFENTFSGKFLIPTVTYPDSSSDFHTLLAPVRAAVDAHQEGPVALVCNCDADEIVAIMDAMVDLGWPGMQTRMFVTDRATPTRAVVAPENVHFAASVNMTGILSSLPTHTPSYQTLLTRWRAGGQTTSIFASALSLYDGVRMAARTLLMLRDAEPSLDKLQTAFRSTALQSWGASGMMTVGEDGDLVRGDYDVYAVDAETGWQVVGFIST